MAIIGANPQVTRKELAVLLNRSPESIRHHLQQLTQNSVIKHEGSTKAGKWVIL
ncbi:winged helix-turn-helix transcriptional regulator [Bacteroides sp. UBA939]|uniref:winged helix-turn-helix transcriptional regulator n=1 Tax=Bacteroides sp. UBA939 TaxID=1946092 RepID=UPI0039C8818B